MYFKILRLEDDGVFDITHANNLDEAYKYADCPTPFRIVEATRSEYLRWQWTDWKTVDAFERDIQSVCGF